MILKELRFLWYFGVQYKIAATFSFELCLQMHDEFSQTRGFNKQK